MSRQVESDVVQAVVDGLDFARNGRSLSGRVPVAALPRLADVLVSDIGAMDCEIIGERDRDGNAYLVLQLEGSLGLRCQRCLEVLAWPLRIKSKLLLVPPGEAWPDDELEEDGFDAIEAGKEMALLPLIEDEVLLALPVAPRHEICEPPIPVGDEREPSPFAVLAGLRRKD